LKNEPCRQAWAGPSSLGQSWNPEDHDRTESVAGPADRCAQHGHHSRSDRRRRARVRTLPLPLRHLISPLPRLPPPPRATRRANVDAPVARGSNQLSRFPADREHVRRIPNQGPARAMSRIGHSSELDRNVGTRPKLQKASPVHAHHERSECPRDYKSEHGSHPRESDPKSRCVQVLAKHSVESAVACPPSASRHHAHFLGNRLFRSRSIRFIIVPSGRIGDHSFTGLHFGSKFLAFPSIPRASPAPLRPDLCRQQLQLLKLLLELRAAD
jgi:hypothetical protein